MKNYNFINELINISNEKKALMQSICDVTKRQQRFLQLKNIGTVLKQIELKDKYMLEVDKLDVRFCTIFNELKLNLGVDTIDKIDVKRYPQMKELKKIVGEILKLTEEIQTIDNENRDMLKKDMGETSNKLRGVKQGRKASNAYGAYKNQVTSVFFDKKK